MVDNTTLVALKIDRNSKTIEDFRQRGSIHITRVDNEGVTNLEFYSTHPECFSLSTTDLDLEEVRGRAQSMVRVNRQDGEKVIIELENDISNLQQDCLFFNKYGEDRFMIWAEPAFVITNKIYNASAYKRSDVDLEESLKNDIEALLSGEAPRVYNRQRAIECRILLLRLDEIIDGEATQQLREKAIDAKFSINEELERVRLLKNKAHLAKVFKDKVHVEKFSLMEKLIKEKLGEVELSKLHSQAMQNVKNALGINESVVGALVEVENSHESEKERVVDTLKSLPFFNELEGFISNGDKPPTIQVERCKICGKKPSITPTTTANGKTKRFVARCQCGATAGDGKIGADAVINWNLENADSLRVDSIPMVDFSGLSNEDIVKKIGAVDQFCHRRRRLISIETQLTPGSDKKRFNKLKGKLSILDSVSRYAKAIMKQQELV